MDSLPIPAVNGTDVTRGVGADTSASPCHVLNEALVNNLAVRSRARAQRYARHRVQVGTEERRAPGTDRLACFLAKNAHEPAQELLHKPESAIHLVLTGQNRSLLWPCACSGSLGRWWTGCGQLFP